MTAQCKSTIDDLAIFGGDAAFQVPRSTSGLSQPDFKQFLEYARRFYEAGQFTNNGPNVRDLEERLAALHGTEYCVTFCSGFWAIVLTVRALAMPGRTEIVMPSLTYRRMADIAAWVPLTPRFCEVDSQTLAVSRASLEPEINERTALIMAVQPIVNCCDVPNICALAKETGIPLIFDSVESVYEDLPTGKIGQFGDAECFSLHASKLINGFEGGYVTTNNADLAHKLKSQRSFGFSGPDTIEESGGINAKLCEIHASMALANLDCLEQTIAENLGRYRVYQQRISAFDGLSLLTFDEACKTSFKNIVLEVKPEWPVTRDEMVQILNSESILARAYYDPPLHRKPMRYPHIKADLPMTNVLAKHFISMPCGAHVTEADIDRIVDVLDFVFRHGKSIKARMNAETVANNV